MSGSTLNSAGKNANSYRSGVGGAVVCIILAAVCYWALTRTDSAPDFDTHSTQIVAGGEEKIGVGGTGRDNASQEGSYPDERPGSGGEDGQDGDRASLGEGLTLTGTVVNGEYEPIPLARVRWLPVSENELTKHDVRHDGFLVMGSLDLSHFPSSLRDPLLRSRFAQADEAGTFEIHVPSSGDTSPFSGSSLLLAWAPGLTLESVVLSFDVSEPSEYSLGLIELAPAAEVCGTVTDRATGEPAAGMIVHSRTANRGSVPILVDGEGQASARVGPHGRFALVGLAPGEQKVHPTKGDGVWVGLTPRQGRSAWLRPGDRIMDVDFLVDRGGIIRGVVRGSDGIPAKVVAVWQNFLESSMHGNLEGVREMQDSQEVTDEEGRFAIQGLALGKEYTVLVRAEGFAPASSEPVELTTENPEKDVALHLDQGSSVSGFVVDGASARVSGASVYLTPQLYGMLARKQHVFFLHGVKTETTTDEAGLFSFRHLPPGTFTLRVGEVNTYDVLGTDASGVQISLDGTENLTDIELSLASDIESLGEGVPGSILGRVMDDRGDPLVEASVGITSAGGGMFGLFSRKKSFDTKTDEEGHYQFEDVAEGEYNLVVEMVGHEKSEGKGIRPDGVWQEHVLSRLSLVSGIVVLSGGEPAPPPFRVRALTEGGPDFGDFVEQIMTPRKRGETTWEDGNEGGTFSLAGLNAGPFIVEAEVPGHAMGRSELLDLVPGQEITDLTIVVSAGATISGSAVLSNGERLAGVTVTLFPATKDQSIRMMQKMMPAFMANNGRDTSTNEEGDFAIEFVSPGFYSISATHPDYAPSAELDVAVKVDENVALGPLVLSLGGTIQGVVTNAGEPRAGMMIQMYGDGPMKVASSDTRGEYSFQKLRPGDYIVTIFDAMAFASGKGVSMKTKKVTVEGEEIQEVDFPFGTGLRVFGILNTPPGSRGLMTMVTLRVAGGPGPEDLDLTDITAQFKAAEYQVGVSMVGKDGGYAILDVAPGEYILEVPAMPRDLTDIEGFNKMDRTPLFRRTIQVNKQDLEMDIYIQ